MSQYVTRIFELLCLPPGIFIVLLLLSILFVCRVRLLKGLLLLQVLLIYALSIPLTSHYLFAQLELIPALSQQQIQSPQADVIVVLAGGIKAYSQEYHGPDINYFTQLRLRYAAWLQKQTQLPMLVTGGVQRAGVSEAELMAQVLRNEYAVTEPIWIEKQSQNTFENARYSHKLLLEKSLNRIYLVTSAFHMPRALMAFRQYEREVIPAPMGYYHNSMNYLWGDFLPNSNAMRENYLALHELFGHLWYRLYYNL